MVQCGFSVDYHPTRVLLQCWYVYNSYSYAVYNSIVSVSLPSSEQESCSVDGEIRLSGGPNEFEGRVEVCIG